MNNHSVNKSIAYQVNLTITNVVLTTDEIVVAFNTNANGEKSIPSNQIVLDSLNEKTIQDILTILTEFKPIGDGDDFNKLLILYAEFHDKIAYLNNNNEMKQFETIFVQKSHDIMGHDNNQTMNCTLLTYKRCQLTMSDQEGFFIRGELDSDFMLDFIKIPPGGSQCYFKGTFKSSHPISGFIRSLDQNNLNERCVCFDEFDLTNVSCVGV